MTILITGSVVVNNLEQFKRNVIASSQIDTIAVWMMLKIKFIQEICLEEINLF